MGVEINLLTSNSLRAALDELVPQFERASGHKVKVSYDPAKRILRRIAGGEAPDVVICGDAALKDIAGQGKIAAGTSRPVARCSVGLGVIAGAPKPEIGSVESFKRALLAAKSVAYTQEGASGIHFAGLIERLGIAEEMKTRSVRQPGGLVGELLVAGKAELAVQQIPELLAVPGVELVGPLPQAIQATTQSAAAIFASSPRQDAARAFLDFLGSPASRKALTAHGLEPV